MRTRAEPATGPKARGARQETSSAHLRQIRFLQGPFGFRRGHSLRQLGNLFDVPDGEERQVGGVWSGRVRRAILFALQKGERSRAALGDGGDPPRVALLQEFVGVGSACRGRGRLAGGKSEPSERLHCSAGLWGAAAAAGATAGYPKAANRIVGLDLAAGSARSRLVRGGASLWDGGEGSVGEILKA